VISEQPPHPALQIRKRTSTIRGRVKNEVIKNMAQSYGFRVVNSDEDRSFNKERATELLRKYAYIYEVNLDIIINIVLWVLTPIGL